MEQLYHESDFETYDEIVVGRLRKYIGDLVLNRHIIIGSLQY